jgi:hypothetical protein
MGRIFGFVVGAVWLVFAGVAFRNSAAGWSADASDLGFWWGVVAVFLTIASVAAFFGTWLHTRPEHHGVVEPVERAGQH